MKTMNREKEALAEHLSLENSDSIEECETENKFRYDGKAYLVKHGPHAGSDHFIQSNSNWFAIFEIPKVYMWQEETKFFWDDAEDHGGFDRNVPCGPFDSRKEAIIDVASLFRVKPEVIEGKPERYN